MDNAYRETVKQDPPASYFAIFILDVNSAPIFQMKWNEQQQMHMVSVPLQAFPLMIHSRNLFRKEPQHNLKQRLSF